MCRLIGIIGAHPLPLQETLSAFLPLGTQGKVKCTMQPGHLDGWGISGLSQKRAVYFGRRAEPVTDGKKFFDDAIDKAAKSQSPVVVGHLRKASAGGRDISNTHPFHYRDWIFAHNGTIFGANASFPLYDAQPQGQTDSERYFMWIVENIQNADDRTEALVQLIRKRREELVYTALNFVLTDGVTLWAYREYGTKRFDPGETLEERDKYYTLYFGRVERSAVVCSEPLTSLTKTWLPMGQRTLAVFSPEMIAPRTITV